jgi:murein DD-endopeptidase MepM/ murein hydrolase activator NlpD
MTTPPDKQKPKLSQFFAEFPRKHLVIATSIVIATFFSLLLTPGEGISQRTTQPLELKIAPPATPETISATEETEPSLPWKELEIQSGDNLSIIFQRASLSATDVYEITNNSENSDSLLKLFPGQKLSLQIDEEGKLQALKHIHDKFSSTLYQRDGKNFSTVQITREPEIRQNYSSATITSSLFRAAQNAGLPQNMIMELANVFGGVIDFVYDVRAGDGFTLLYEEYFLDEEKTGNGPILAAQFTNRGETYTAYRYVFDDGSTGYYNEEGISMRKAFLRAPLDFTRISSNFNLKRLHPIFKTNKPHRGIDYAAPTGTPVYAAGDGRVIASGYSKANGNYVFISHGTQYQTKYLHLNKRGVKKGQQVKQQQIIGWVGSTGYATGPHLHYEFLVNGTHQNPRTIVDKLPKAESIDAKEKANFLAQISGVQMQLATYNNHQKFAKSSQLSGDTTL